MKALKILENYDTEAKIEYLQIYNSNDPIDKWRAETLRRKLVEQAKVVLNGECPHERPYIGTTMKCREPRSWMRYREEVAVYGKCKFCGE